MREQLDALYDAIGKKNPALLAGGEVTEHLRAVCEDIISATAYFKADYNIDITFGAGHIESLARQLVRAYADYDPLAEPEAREKALQEINKRTDREYFKMIGRDFELTPFIREELSKQLGFVNGEMDRTSALSRFFREGECMRMGRVGAVAAAAGAVGYALLHAKRKEAESGWAAREEAASAENNDRQR